MALTPASSAKAVVVDANLIIAICAKETFASRVRTALFRYAVQGNSFYTPGVCLAETLYILCQKEQSGVLSASDHGDAIEELEAISAYLSPPPHGDASLILRAEQVRAGYGCSHSADGLYIALAEQLAQTQPTVLLTLDVGLARQAARNAPAVTVDLLLP